MTSLVYNQPGSSPGQFDLGRRVEPLRLSVVDYNETKLEEVTDATLEHCAKLGDSKNVTWIHAQGVPDARTLEILATHYGLHALAVEDVVNIGQRPKIETYDHIYFTTMSVPLADENGITIEQASIFLGETFVISFVSGGRDPFEPIRDRLRTGGSGRIRKRKADYLYYALIDLIVDLGFPVLDGIADKLDRLEDRILEEPDEHTLEQVHEIKRTLILLRRNLSPHREVLNSLIRDKHKLISERTLLYLRDCYDHAIRIIDLLESLRDLTSSLRELFMTSVSNRMNEVMKVLTIIATIFIPLGFVAGLYGMNFDPEASPWNMPELSWYFGYPMVWLLLVLIVAGMLFYFRKKKWL